jgi:hypothetical protein
MKRREFTGTIGIATGGLLLSGLTLPKAFSRSETRLAKAQIEKLRGEAPAEAEIRSERGGPRLFLNGREIYPFMAGSTQLYPTIENYKAARILLIHPVLGTRSVWTGPDRYEWTLFDTFFGHLLELYPGAFFLPRVQLNTPEWWKDANPGELIRFGLPTPADGSGSGRSKVLWSSEGGHLFNENEELREASFASEVWRRDTAVMLRAFLEHIDASPLASRVIGYHPTTGWTAEWNFWGEDYMPDYSEPMRKAAGPIPDAASRMHSSFGLLRDPAKEGEVIRYYRAYHHAVGETVCSIARAIKQGSSRKVLCGVFYGYISEIPRIQEGGYQASELVMASPDIDYIAAPYTYQPGNAVDEHGVRVTMVDGAGNRLGNARGVAGDGAYRVPIESLRRRGKMFIAELDPSTYRDAAASSVTGGLGGQGSDTLEGSLRILRRDLGGVFAEGIGGWLYDFGVMNKAPEGWYSGEPIVSEIRKLVSAGNRRSALDIRSEAEICTVGDVDSYSATAHWTYGKPWTNYGIKATDYFNHWFVNTQGRAIHRIGAPKDELYRFDLTAADARRYKLFLIPNAYLLESAEAERIRSLLRESGTTVLWFYAPGYLTAEGFDLAQMERLTGFGFTILDAPGTMLIDCTIRERDVPSCFGVNESHAPRFAVRGSGFETLGEWSDGKGVAFAQKSYEGYRSIYVGSAPVPAPVLRILAQQAGVRLWSSSADIVRATHDAAMIVATARGKRTFTLPRAMASVEGGAASARHELDMELGDVKIFSA